VLKIACPLTLSFPLYSQPYSFHLGICLKKNIYVYVLEWEKVELLPSTVSACKPFEQMILCLWQQVIHYINIMSDTVR
jgi:hypothetical protein